LLLKLFHINLLSCPSNVYTFFGSVEEDTTRSLANTKQQPSENDLKTSVGRQYCDLKPAADTSEVSEHYQYCFRNSPYEDSNQQYRKAGNRTSCVKTTVPSPILPQLLLHTYCASMREKSIDHP
jgi:hypothetical protein